MPRIERFEDLDCWVKGRELTKAIYNVTSSGKFARDLSLKDQIRRSVVSILSNSAEGFERGGDREFLQFLGFAKGSAGEVKAQLYVALDAGFITQEEFRALYDLADETSRLIGGLMRYLKHSDFKGPKFK